MPPDSETPTGTSEMSWRLTASGVVVADPLEPLVPAPGRVRGPVDGRVLPQPGPALGELQRMARREAADAGEERPVTGDVADVHRQVQAGLVDLGADQPAGQHGLGLGPEGQLAVPDRVHQRLDPERVPDQEQRAAAPVVQGEREDPVEPGGERDPLVLVEVGQDLGVAVGGQPVPAGQHQLPELGVVVDLAVVHDDDRAVLVGHRLGAARHVLDGQPAVAEVDLARRCRSPRRRGPGARSCRPWPGRAPRHRSRPYPLSRTPEATVPCAEP